jgi:hypothetical protein
MTNPWRARGVFLSLLLIGVGTASCSTTQPTRSLGRTASITMSATADGTYQDCYEVWQDTDGDGTPDTDTGFRTCEEALVAGGGGVGTVPYSGKPVPWRYSMQITVIHSGSTQETVVKSVNGVLGSSVEPGGDNFVSLTDYDPQIQTANVKPPDPPLFYLNGKRVSTGSPVYLSAQGFDVGTPNILTETGSFNFDITSGDTIIVRARKQAVAQSPGFIISPNPDLLLAGVFFVDGAAIGADSLNGSSASTAADKSGFTFSYTVK